MYKTERYIVTSGGNPPGLSARIVWNRERWRRGAGAEHDGAEAVGFAAAIRFLYARPADQPVFLFYDRGWGDTPGVRGTWTICPIEGECWNGQTPLLELTRAAAWLLARHGFLDRNTYGGFKARRIHDVKLRPERAWFLEHAEAIEAGHAAGIEFARREANLDDAEKDVAQKRRDRKRRRTRRTAMLEGRVS
jgi:hypothetical protein